ncbi:dihydroorotase [Gillisia mitskevichiae]|uniref:Dihydroorotase n=1 Tax=Gillisia mitskevichiae TaxID=270921 RepID=A0A495PUX9_9FLAO|nr:dihydroorotase [Gillisia mitskevichiae]RKS53268.1 dihydroorotase [Gillisia mitskevichiae]
MKLLLKAAKIIDPGSKYHQKKVDILIEGGIIKKIGASLKIMEVDKEIDLKNLHVSKGWFDSSVSFGEPGYEERETIINGLCVAGKSGFTQIALNPGTYPVLDNNSSITSVKSKAENNAVQIFTIGALTNRSEGKDLAELYDMHQAGAIAFGDYKKSIAHPNLLKLSLLYAQNFDGLVQSFPQDDQIAGYGLVNENINSTSLGLNGIPALAEELQIIRDLYILEYTGGKLHIPTISTEKSVKLIKDAKKRGLDVSCSVAIHNLIFTDDELVEFDTRFKVLPPLRTKADIKALRKGVLDGTIDMVTSDHTPIDVEHKKVEFEHALYGTIGLETAFGALSSIFSLDETISILTKGRARFKLPELEIKEGVQANFTLFDPEVQSSFHKEDIHSSSKNSMFLDFKMKGKVYGIINGARSIMPSIG